VIPAPLARICRSLLKNAEAMNASAFFVENSLIEIKKGRRLAVALCGYKKGKIT